MGLASENKGHGIERFPLLRVIRLYYRLDFEADAVEVEMLTSSSYCTLRKPLELSTEQEEHNNNHGHISTLNTGLAG